MCNHHNRDAQLFESLPWPLKPRTTSQCKKLPECLFPTNFKSTFSSARNIRMAGYAFVSQTSKAVHLYKFEMSVPYSPLYQQSTLRSLLFISILLCSASLSSDSYPIIPVSASAYISLSTYFLRSTNTNSTSQDLSVKIFWQDPQLRTMYTTIVRPLPLYGFCEKFLHIPVSCRWPPGYPCLLLACASSCCFLQHHV